MVTARTAMPAELRPIGTVLAAAFHDDPVMGYMQPDEGVRRRRLPAMFAAEARRHLRDGGVYTNDGIDGAALWAPPGRWRARPFELVRLAPSGLAFVGRNAARAFRGLAVLEKAHPREPHWYLAVLGTDPSRQGTGVGTALMAPVLDRCDREGTPAYLESSKESNVPFYRRFGFAVTGRIDLPGGPTLWPMWRDPQLSPAS